MTPVDASAAKRAFDTVKGWVTYLWRLGKRIATLEERVTAIEESLKIAPPEACPYCGERAMRLHWQSGVMGATKNTSNASRFKPDDSEQSKRFIDAAKEAGADETEAAADRAFKKIIQKPHKDAK
jgi:isopropylmalate/homocitrate/citramalate synthase